MKHPTKRNMRHVAAMALLAAGSAGLMAQDGVINLRPLTPQDLKTYSLPATTQTTGGLNNTGLGQPFYLEALVRTTVASSNILGVTWEITSKPVGSSVALEASPLTAAVPTFNPADQTFYNVAGRMMLRPDVAGQYVVTATVDTNGGNMVITKEVTGATYMGKSTCSLCHSGGFLPDMVTSYSESHHATTMTRYLDGIDTDHFTQNCIKCHSTGFDADPLAVNGGFDDLQALTGWTMPTELVPGNWAAMPAELKEKSNVQCESCHGAGSEHAYNLGKKDYITLTLGAGDCSACHDSQTHHNKTSEWKVSRHAIATRSPTGESRAACVRCHSAPGFVDFADGVDSGDPELRKYYEAITCGACHDPHGDSNPHILRKMDVVKLSNNMEITEGGYGKLCMNCHMSRVDASTYVETTAGSSRFGPHHGPQSDMLLGVNAYDYGKEIPSSAHRDVVENTCVDCHLQEVATSSPAFLKAGGHTFNPGSDNGTPDDPSDDIHLTESCQACHGPIETFNFKRADYDGDGVVEGVQDEVRGLLDTLGMLLPPIGSPTVSISSSYTKPQLRAAFNYQFVLEDKSFGVHNLSYAVGLLKTSIADLTDDADHDGLSDKWEIANFGGITMYNGNDDPDQDGAKNSLELSAGTNPLLADSDGDGISDGAELMAGSDPNNAQDTPGFVVKIYTAGEIEFFAETGKKYQVQRVSEITGAWVDVGEVVEGAGENVSMLTSTRNDTQNFYRVVNVP